MKVMKKVLSIALSVIMVLSCMSGIVFGAPKTDYGNMFSKSISIDGINADQLSIDLGKAFNADSEKFMSELYMQSPDVINNVTSLLVYDASFTSLDKFEKKVAALKTGKMSKEGTAVIDSINKHIKKAQKDIEEAQSLPAVETPVAPVFDPETILNFIELNKSTGNVDEEFYEAMGKSYRSDPKLFAETLSTLADEDVQSVSKYVAYDCLKKGVQSSNNDQSKVELTDRGKEVLSTIELEITKDNNKNLKNIVPFVEYESVQQSEVSLMATPTLSIGTMTYTTTPLMVGETEKVSVAFKESASASYTRTYWTEVYCVKNGTAYLKASKLLTIPPSATSITNTYSLNFSSVGPVYTLVKVYPYQGGSLLLSKQDTSSVTVKGKWKINVSLPTNRNYKGTITLYAADGTQKQSNECLGRSASNGSMLVYQGNTPTGEYTGYLYGPMSDTAAYGVYKVVNMTGVSGVIKDSGRSGIWIHGGRYPCSNTTATYYPLSPTYGCVRISPTNQQALQNNIATLTSSSGYHDSTGKISISQY